MKAHSYPDYQGFLSKSLLEYLLAKTHQVPGVADLREVRSTLGFSENPKYVDAHDASEASAFVESKESKESLSFLCELYELTAHELNSVLRQRALDREFIDQRTRICSEFNSRLKVDFSDSSYHTVMGHQDAQGRIVVGPKTESYHTGVGKKVAPIPEFLQGPHVTLFGPPDDAKLSINAMNAFHRKLKDEPAVVAEILEKHSSLPKWGADDEDSKTPLHRDLMSAAENLDRCFDRTLSFKDPETGKSYKLADSNLALPIKRFPGLALPCLFYFYRSVPLPLHLYDFALHLFRNWNRPGALAFYVPKLENEEEARYIRILVDNAEKLLRKYHPEYLLGTVRLLIVLENPRAVFRVNEIMDELYPYFAGASLGWHDYLASTARLFKEDPNYRIPVKADPNIVIKYIKASHTLLSDVVGARGGIKIGGMYGVLPVGTDLHSPSFQVTIKGFIKDVVTQLKRGLSGFWVAHPDFVRIGLALVEAWESHKKGSSSVLESLVSSLLNVNFRKEVLDFIHGPDIEGLSVASPSYPRALIVADLAESNWIPNHHPDEIRYNVFQTLQYLADWLSGNGCVALPALIDEVPVRVMDDLATAERSRWEVWHEIRHGRFELNAFLRIAHEELHFIRKDLSNDKKIVQVKWDDRTAKWYPVAFHLMLQLMTQREPVEFASELLLPFTINSIRSHEDPLDAVKKIDPKKFSLSPYIDRFCSYFAACGNEKLASELAQDLVFDRRKGERVVQSFDLAGVQEAAFFHGDIGESKKTLDHLAAEEQSRVFQDTVDLRQELRTQGEAYRKKFQMKFLISAQGKTGSEILSALSSRMNNTFEQELQNAKTALWEIACKRLDRHPSEILWDEIESARERHGIVGVSVSLTWEANAVPQSLCFGHSILGASQRKVTPETRFEIASLSKSLAAWIALEYFGRLGVSIHTSVNSLFEKTSSAFRLRSVDDKRSDWGDQVTLSHLLNHSALNMHYVNGIPLTEPMPSAGSLLEGNSTYGYEPVRVIARPGSVFQYSGGGFLVLEHLMESLEGMSIVELSRPFLRKLGVSEDLFHQKSLAEVDYACGYTAPSGSTEPSPIQNTRHMHPAFAAGGIATAKDISLFLHVLTEAYQGGSSHTTARQMLFGTDHGCQKFMRANMGLGVFIAEAGPNRLAIHQGANDGFRALYVHCFSGPDLGKGFVILCSGELNGVLFRSEAAQAILSELKMNGVQLEKFRNRLSKQFNTSNVPAEQIVNVGYRDLIFSAFEKDLPEAIVDKGPHDPLAQFNLVTGAKILEVSNQRFARAENLISEYHPVFDPSLFGRQGKIMDSWETVRHNPDPSDDLVLELASASTIRYVSFSTQYHLGNHVPAVRVQGFDSGQGTWVDLVSKTTLAGHSIKKVKSQDRTTIFQKVKVSVFPDGGLSRLGLYSESLPEREKTAFAEPGESVSVPCQDPIEKTVRPLVPSYKPKKTEIQKNWASVSRSKDSRSNQILEVDLASSALGGTVVSASNEHYGPAEQVISPYPPIHMFDGLESARSRVPGHFEEVTVELGKVGQIRKIEMDFKFFVNNNPLEVAIQGLNTQGQWIQLVPRTWVKGYAGNHIVFQVQSEHLGYEFSRVQVLIYPDGGFNRLHVFGSPKE